MGQTDGNENNYSVISEAEYKQFLDDLSASSVVVPNVYKEVFLDNYRYFILSSGRLSGKTSILVGLWWATVNKYPDRDIVILQATATEIKDSIINEIEKFLSNSGFDVGDGQSCEWHIPKSKSYISSSSRRGRTYFYPITDSKGGQRSRGINTPNPLSLVLYEEAQKNKDANVVEQSVITFIRQLDAQAKLVIVGNNETAGHWFVDYVFDKRKDPDWHYIYANCYHIWALLNEQTQKYVEGVKAANYTEFRRVFLGDINASSSDVVFPQFERAKHYKRAYQLEKKYITTLILGIDPATAGTFACVPVAVLDDGTTQTLEVLYDDPKETNRTLSGEEQCELLDGFLCFLDDRYGVVANQLPIYLSVDGAALWFVKSLKHWKNTSKNKVWKIIKIKSFTMKKKDKDLGIIKNAFAYGVLTILNEGANQYNGSINVHRLAREIEKQRYKNGKLDPNIDNDLVDALEYGLIPYYSNCYNLSFPIRKRDYLKSAHVEDIKKIAGIKSA